MSYLFTATSSGSKSASTQISSMSSLLIGIDVSPPSIGQSVIILYDGSASGLVLAEIYLDAGLQGLNHSYTIPIRANNGIYAQLTGTTVTYIVHYALG